jgi:phytoene desaturase
VERLDVVNGKVKGVVLESGETIKATKVVSNADPSTVYTKWIDAKDRKRHTNRSVERKRQSMSLFVAYFGTKKTYPDLAHHTIVLGPRYKGLLKDVFSKKILADDFSLYLHAPTRSDPSVAPQGCENFYVLSPVPNQKSGLDWSELQEEYLDRILTHLDQNQLPGLKENLITQKAIDPRYFQQEMRSHQGNAFGIEPVLQQSAYMRYHNVSEDVEGLFFVGAATHPGAGLPGVIGSAKVLEAVMPPPLKRQPIPHVKKIRMVS